MTAGVPGAGIAGLFYLAGALLAPLWNLARGAGIQPGIRPWTFVWRLALLALSMLTGIALAGLLIGLVLTSPSSIAHLRGVPHGTSTTPFFIARVTVFLTIGTLVIVLAAVEVLAFFASPRRISQRRSRRPTAAGSQP
jgi:preprotein translocase subunit SecG